MARYIDADLIVYDHAVARSLDDGHNWNELVVCKDQIDDIPTADVVKVVRCKDCKHYKIDHPRANGYHCCYRMHSIFPMKPDDFCSYAERREYDEQVH